MRINKIVTLFLLGIASGCFMGNLAAWERQPVDWARCKKDGKSQQRCQKENAEDNEYNFTALLSPNSYKIYEDFTPAQRKMAMDYADGDQMDPNDAVAEVNASRMNS